MKPLVVIDDGHTSTKVVWMDDLGGGGKLFPSKAVLGLAETASGEVKGASVYYVDQKVKPRPHQIYTLYGSEHPITVDNRHDRFPESNQNRVLVHHALVSTELVGEVDIITTVPVHNYFMAAMSNTKDETRIQSKNRNLAGKCYRRDNQTKEGEEPQYVLGNLTVLPEGVYAIYDVALDAIPDGEQLIRFEEKYFSSNRSFAVIDIGGKTTDVIIGKWNCEDHTFEVDIQRSRSLLIGVMDAATRLERAIEVRFDIPNLASDAVNLLQKARIQISGVSHDISDLVDDTVKLVGNQIRDKIAPLLDGYQQFGVIIFCGGGAALFRDIATNYPSTIVHTPENPQFSNAQGILKFTVMQWNNEVEEGE